MTGCVRIAGCAPNFVTALQEFWLDKGLESRGDAVRKQWSGRRDVVDFQVGVESDSGVNRLFLGNQNNIITRFFGFGAR
jgi:hypothetical protein